MAGLYHGHILEFPSIRVDSFAAPPPGAPFRLPDPADPSAPTRAAPNAQLYLLSHVHADHLVGLTSAFTGRIVCTPESKRMLLRLEAEVDRKNYLLGKTERPRRKYDGLRARTVLESSKERVVDLIEAVPSNLPRQYEVGYQDGKPVVVTVTLIDANHCPGSAMFLVTGQGKAILHTGDLRADRLFLQSLRRNTMLNEYFVPWPGVPVAPGTRRRQLDRIYFDNSALLGTGDMPDKEEPLMEMIAFMSLYPPDTVFFLDVSCFGWEDVIREVARHFGCLIHVDPYKHSIYTAVQTDPFLLACTTLDPNATRFHACERLVKCAACRTWDAETGTRRWNTDKRVVSVNMVEVKTAAWEVEKRDFVARLEAAALGEAEWPYSISVPIARHSTLPELRRLVALFHPHALSPNTLAHVFAGRDYYYVPDIFADCLDDGALAHLRAERDAYFAADPRFGEGYLRAMQAEALGRALASGTPHGASRKAYAADQVSRMAAPAVDAAGIGGASVSDFTIDAGAAWLPPSQGDVDDYDTDEEKNEARRKRRAEKRPTQAAIEAKVEPADLAEPAPPAGQLRLSTVATAEPQDAAHVRVPPDAPPRNARDAGLALGGGVVKAERDDRPAVVERRLKRRRASRFSVDSAHLAALVGVKVDKAE